MYPELQVGFGEDDILELPGSPIMFSDDGEAAGVSFDFSKASRPVEGAVIASMAPMATHTMRPDPGEKSRA